MPYIGNPIYQSAFVTDTFSGNGSTTAFTMSVAPAGVTNVLVAISGVLQDPATYGVVGTTLNFSAAPPSGTGNISVRYLGVPATGVVTTAYRTVTEFTATAGQTTFTPPSYTVGFIDVYRNGVLLGSGDFTATNGTTIVLANPATAGDLVETISFLVSSVLNAIPNTAGSVGTANIANGAITAAKMGSNGTWAPSGTVIQVINASTGTNVTSTSTSYVDTGLTATITPKFATSKILVLVNQQGILASGTGYGCGLAILRASTNICQISIVQSYIAGGATSGAMTGAGANFLDSPATTSATTYKTQFNSSTGSQVAVQNNGDRSTITLMEIAA
jgi:hypothetical protein